MANKRISELNELTTVDVQSNDLLVIYDASQLETKRIQSVNLKNYVLNGGDITGSITNAINSETASYLDYTGIINGTASYSINSSFSETSSYVSTADTSILSDTASYVKAEDVDGNVLSSSYSNTSSYLNYRYNNGIIENSKTASYCKNSQTSSYLLYTNNIINGTASYALTASMINFNGTASYLTYSGIPNGTSSCAMSVGTNFITASYLLMPDGKMNGSASYAMTSSWSNTASFASRSSFLIYSPSVPNGTSSYSMKSFTSSLSSYASTAGSATTANFASSAYDADTSSFCDGTSSYAKTASYCSLTASYALVAENVATSSMYKIYGPYSADSQTTTTAYTRNFVIHVASGVPKTCIIQAFGDVKVPITQTETSMYVRLYIDNADPSTPEVSQLDESNVANYINFAYTGAFSLSGYNKQSFTLGGSSNLSGSWYAFRVEAGGGALIDTRTVKFLIYTRADSLEKTNYPPY